MKKLLSILLFISTVCCGQISQPNAFTQFQQFGSPTTWTRINGALYAFAGFVNAEFTDTTSANLSNIKNAPGAQIRTANKLWMRNSTATLWIEFTTGGAQVYPAAGIAVSNGTAWVSSITDNSTNWNTAFTDRLKWDGGATGLTAATGRTSLGATTVGGAFFTLANPSAITFPRINADNSVSALDAATFRTAIGAGTGGGSVTTVGFTGGIISVANPTTTPAFTVAGTSGGIPYFSSNSTWATSALLAANNLMVGGGAGTAPSTVTTGTGVITALGVNTGSAGAVVLFNGAGGTPSSITLTNGTGLPIAGLTGLGTGVATALAVNVGSSGAFVTFNGALGTPSSGTVTNLTGTASININGTVGATTPTTGAFTTINGNTFTTGSYTITGTAAKTFTFTNSLTLSGTDGSTLNIGTGGTLGTNAYTSTAYAPIASPTFTGTVTIPTPFTLGAISVTSTGTQLNYLNAATGTTGTTSTNVVFSTSPTLVTPILGTPTSVTLTNATGLPEGGLSLTDITTNNVSSSAHGFMPKLTANRVYYVDNSGVWTALALGANGTVLTSAGATSAPTFTAPATNGTVTSVSFTGGIISVATATTTPALTVAGTSGGIPYFSSTTAWASSALLAANALMIGGGAGTAPSTITTGTGVVTALGVNTGSSGAFVVNGGALSTPSSGTVTNLTGTASININGTVGATTPTTGVFTTATANSFIPNLSTIPSNGMYLPASNNLGWGINSAAELSLTATALTPGADGGNSLGTTTLGWQNLFANTGFVLNIENSDWVATHTTGILTVGTGDLRVTTAGTNSASVVTVGGTQTLTGKTLTTPVIGTITNTGTLTLPTVTGTIVQVNNTTVASSSTPTPTGDAKENNFDVTALAANATFAAPSGTPANHNELIVRILDNGTARTLAWNAIYRASSDLALPTTTVLSKSMYLKFIYNSADSKWDFVAYLNNF